MHRKMRLIFDYECPACSKEQFFDLLNNGKIDCSPENTFTYMKGFKCPDCETDLYFDEDGCVNFKH